MEESMQTPYNEDFKVVTMKAEREGDCQHITEHQSLVAASLGFYSLSESHLVANAAYSQSELLILGKLLTRPITQMDSCSHKGNRGQMQ